VPFRDEALLVLVRPFEHHRREAQLVQRVEQQFGVELLQSTLQRACRIAVASRSASGSPKARDHASPEARRAISSDRLRPRAGGQRGHRAVEPLERNALVEARELLAQLLQAIELGIGVGRVVDVGERVHGAG
jgi:hypothetical protein